jgi:hypothetical protein
LWKELRQNLRLGLAAVGVFVGVPLLFTLIAVIRGNGQWYNDALGMVLLGGPILAVIVGVCAMGREQGAIEGFWRSRPVILHRWLVIKYLTGLAIVGLASLMPVLIEMWGKLRTESVRGITEDAATLLVYSFILMLIYSESFVLGQCVQKILHAAILAICVMAMIFLIPLVVAPLNWLSVETAQRVVDHSLDASSLMPFAAAMTAMSITLLWFAGILLKRNIQIELGGRTLGWSIVVILLVLAAGVAFPMGTNLPARQVIPLPTDQNNRVSSMKADGNDVLVLLSSSPELGSSRGRKHGLVHVHIGEEASSVGKPIWFVDPGQEQGISYQATHLMWSGRTSSVAYGIVTRTTLENNTVEQRSRMLYTIALDGGQSDPVVHRVELDPLLHIDDSWLTACLYQNHLYVCGHGSSGAQLLTFSLADPTAPSPVRSEDLPDRIGRLSGPSPQAQIRLVTIPDVNDQARLQVTYELFPDLWTPTGNDRVLASVFNRDGLGMQLELFETQQTQDGVMPLHSVSHRRTPTIERLLGSWFGSFHYSAPFVYQLSGNGVTVYDITSSNRIKRIGHYATQYGFSEIVSLPNNRVVLAGQELHVLDLSKKLASRSAR